MQHLTLYNGNKSNYISVSMDFIDHYVCEAPAEYVKIYLYLLRCMEMNSMNLSVSDIADRFDFTEKDVLRALSYWEKKSLLTLDYDSCHNLCGIHFRDSELGKPSGISSIREFPTARPVQAAEQEPAKPALSRSRMLQLADNPEVKQILFIASQYLGKTLNPAETEILLHIYDNLGFSGDLIEYLIESCVEKNCKSLTYMEKTAQQWHQDGITSVSQARNASESTGSDSLAIMKALGISGRTLAQSEMEYVQKWRNSYDFSIDLVIDACNRTIQAIGRPSFRYTDTILTNWHNQQVRTLDDVQALDMVHQTQSQKSVDKPVSKPKKITVKGSNFPQRAYDYDALEQQLLNVN